MQCFYIFLNTNGLIKLKLFKICLKSNLIKYTLTPEFRKRNTPPLYPIEGESKFLRFKLYIMSCKLYLANRHLPSFLKERGKISLKLGVSEYYLIYLLNFLGDDLTLAKYFYKVYTLNH